MVLIAAGGTVRLALLQSTLFAAREVLCDEVSRLCEEATLRTETEETVAVTGRATSAIEEVSSCASCANAGICLVALEAVALSRTRRTDIAGQIKAEWTGSAVRSANTT